MTTKVRVWIAGVTVVALAGLAYVSGPSYAGGGADLKKDVLAIADMIQKGNNDGAKSKAAAVAKKHDDFEEIMHMFKTRTKGGIGVGKTPGANAAKDGIEVKLRDLARDVPPNVGKEADALEMTGYVIAAMADISTAKVPPKDAGKKTKKAWLGWSADMREAGLAFAKASAAKGGQEIKSAAAKVNAACNNCHSVFKE